MVQYLSALEHRIMTDMDLSHRVCVEYKAAKIYLSAFPKRSVFHLLVISSQNRDTFSHYS